MNSYETGRVNCFSFHGEAWNSSKRFKTIQNGVSIDGDFVLSATFE